MGIARGVDHKLLRLLGYSPPDRKEGNILAVCDQLPRQYPMQVPPLPLPLVAQSTRAAVMATVGGKPYGPQEWPICIYGQQQQQQQQQQQLDPESIGLEIRADYPWTPWCSLCRVWATNG